MPERFHKFELASVASGYQAEFSRQAIAEAGRARRSARAVVVNLKALVGKRTARTE